MVVKVTWVGMPPGTYTPPDKGHTLLQSKLKPIADFVMKNQIYDYGDPSCPKYIPKGTTVTMNISPKNLLIERTHIGTNEEPDRIWLQEY